MPKSISIVIPVYNDQEVLLELYSRLVPVVERLSEQYEIILVDDGSKDDSWQETVMLHRKNKHIVAVKLTRNYGQQNAIAAGLDISSGDIIVLMDSDLQDRPEDIPKLVNALEESQASMAIAQWDERKDSFTKVCASRMFYCISNALTSLHTKPRLGVFRAVRREIVNELKLFTERTATALSLLYYIDSDYVTVPLKRDARFAGRSGYTVSKMLVLTLARVFSFSMFPVRLTTYAGCLIGGASFVVGITLILRRIFGTVAPGWTSVIVLVLFLFGLNFAFLGILGEYIGKIFLESKHRPRYVVKEIMKGQTHV